MSGKAHPKLILHMSGSGSPKLLAARTKISYPALVSFLQILPVAFYAADGIYQADQQECITVFFP